MSIQDCVRQVLKEIEQGAIAAGRDPQEITLCAATKMQSHQAIQEAIAAGVSVCGENRVQELVSHWDAQAYQGAQVHLIGHLQRNKVRQVVGKVTLIHSVDSLALMEAIQREAARQNVVQDILLEVNIGGEDSKGGCTPQESWTLAQAVAQYPQVRLRGLMAIPPISQGPEGNRPYFSAMRQLFIDIKEKIHHNQIDMVSLSMGMSGDYLDAIAEGATLIRLGTALFGPRPQR